MKLAFEVEFSCIYFVSVSYFKLYTLYFKLSSTLALLSAS